jgi:ribosomal protein L16 Arg81 hydroxylase
MTDRLTRLLSPMDPAVFFARYWATEHLHLKRSASHCEDWLCLEDLDRLFQFELLPAESFNVVADGTLVPLEKWSREKTSDRGHYRAVDIERWFQCYLNRSTLILNQAQRSIPSLSRACRSLTRELGFRVWANIYITPPDSSGFARHQDDHEVFIFQVGGSKLWTIHTSGGDAVDLRLEAGDLLYIPRSTGHSARSQEAASIHITFGMSPTYTFELIEELAAVAKGHPNFQQPLLPTRYADGSMDRFDANFRAKLTALIDETAVGTLLDRRIEELGKNQERGWPGRFSDLVHLKDISLNTTVRRRTGILFTVRERSGFIDLNFASRSISVPSFLRACLDRVLGEAPFSIGELQGLISDRGRLDLVVSFVRIGLLEIVGLG